MDMFSNLSYFSIVLLLTVKWSVFASQSAQNLRYVLVESVLVKFIAGSSPLERKFGTSQTPFINI